MVTEHIATYINLNIRTSSKNRVPQTTKNSIKHIKLSYSIWKIENNMTCSGCFRIYSFVEYQYHICLREALMYAPNEIRVYQIPTEQNLPRFFHIHSTGTDRNLTYTHIRSLYTLHIQCISFRQKKCLGR